MVRTSPIAPPGEASRIGGPGTTLSAAVVRAFVDEQLSRADLDGRSVCVLVPDGTRTCPLPDLLSAVQSAVAGRVTRLTVLVALGTHAPMSEAALAAHLGFSGRRHPAVTIANHAWWDPDTLVNVGTIPARRLAELSGGRITQAVPVRVNRAVLDHDVTLIVGPVFPHEVVGFSGGNKYLFPGISGPELIDVSHWLGALITNAEIIGVQGTTAVRALIDDAAALLPGDRLALCVVTGPGDSLRSVSFGEPASAWADAADVAGESHVRYLERPVRRVLAVLPARYGDMWTGAKGFYKVEPAVADGGQVVLYGPHITEFSSTHPDILEIGYHCRDYFVKQWDRFKDRRWGDLAHSTHLRGAGTFDPVRGERFRVTVTLATAIPEDVVRSVNLDYLDPRLVDRNEWEADPDALVVDNAGEDLYRLR